MKNVALTIFVVLIVVTLGLYLVSFQVRETESCMVTTFGKPTRQIVDPGWYFKWPFPIEQVHRFDSRMRVFTVEVEETRTASGDPIIVNTYVVWRISEPLKFFNTIKTVKNAEDELLRSRIRNTQNNVIGKYRFSEFINSDPTKIKFKEIQDDMLSALREAVASADYGIEIKTIGIKQLKVSGDVSKEVFERMRAERSRRAADIIAEGDSQAVRIETEARTISDELIAVADARAKKIRGDGDAKAAQYYKMLDEEPQLAGFLRNLEALQKMLEKNTTYLVPTDKEPFSYLKEMPSLKPSETNESGDN
ncbi:MAG: protease modulator HflC [Sedimentisphaerales bacterium]|nr:protease modulator HflC [Sedimentisphaerales bacterium]